MSLRESVHTDPRARELSTSAASYGPAVASTEISTTIVQRLKVICPLHGIRTLAVWQRGFSDLASTRGWVCRLDRWSYGRFSLLAFLTPWTREAKRHWFRLQYNAEINVRHLKIEQGQTPSVVAHSFGTYILGYTLLQFDFIRFNKVILCGSILPEDFPWDKLIERGQVQAVRNEYGVRDPWVKRVRWFVRGTGPSGASGFTCQHDRLEQEQFAYDHGDYFGTDHMEDRWIPFLNKPLAEIPRARDQAVIRGPKMAAPWGLYGVVLALASIAGAVAVMAVPRLSSVGIWIRRPQPATRPLPFASNAPAAPASVSPEALARLVQVQRDGVIHTAVSALPLRTGDRYSISIDVPPGMKPSIFLFDSEGILSELPAHVEPGSSSDAVSFPALGQVVPLTGPPGTELILVVAGRDGPLLPADLQEFLTARTPLPPLPSGKMLLLGADRVRLIGLDDRGVGEAERGVQSSVQTALDHLRRGLRDRASFLAAVAFPHVDAAPGPK